MIGNAKLESDFTVDSWVYWSTGGTFSESMRTGLPTEGTQLHAVGDLDEDGWPEIVLAHSYDGSSYATESAVRWGSPSGYSAADVTTLPTWGAYGAPIIVGGDATR